MRNYLLFILLILLPNLVWAQYHLQDITHYFSDMENIVAEFKQIDYNNNEIRYGKIYIKNNKKIKIIYDNAFILYNGKSILYKNLDLNEVTYLPRHNQFLGILTGKIFLDSNNYSFNQNKEILNLTLNFKEGDAYLSFNTKPSLYIKSIEILTEDLQMLVDIQSIQKQIIPDQEFIFKDDKFLGN